MLSDQQIEFYEKNGFVVPDFSISNSDLFEIRELQEKFVLKYPEFRDYCSTLLAYETGFLRFLKIPEIISMVSQIIGENIALWNSSLFSKPAHNGLTTPWHQDGEYWPIRPLKTCTVWLAIDDATTENGCLQYMPGSHLQQELRQHKTDNTSKYTLNQEITADAYDEDKAFNLEIKAGQIALHDVYIVHGSKANQSSNPRRSMTMRYMPTSSVFDRELAAEMHKKTKIQHQDRTLFLMKGIDLSGKNDFIQRK